MRGSGRPASRAAGAVAAPMCSASVFGPVIQVMVPSASLPVSSSITGPSAATSTRHGRRARHRDLHVHPVLLAL